MSNMIKRIEHFSDFPKPNGDSYFTVQCPFCGGYVSVQKWSFRSQGKRCDGCDALLRNPNARRLSSKHIAVMIQVKDGADVFSNEIKRLLEEVKEYDITSIHIVEPMGEYPERKDKPLCGAILTASGKRHLKRAKEFYYRYQE